MNPEIIAKLAETMRGPVIGRDHPDYDDARKLYNAMIDKRPLLIARCADVGRCHRRGEFRPREQAAYRYSRRRAQRARFRQRR